MDVWQKYTSEHVNGVRLSTSIFDHFEKDAHRIFATNPSKVSLEIWRLTLPKARFQKSCLNSDASLNLFFQVRALPLRKCPVSDIKSLE